MQNVANGLRALSLDMVHTAQSGHIGLPLGIADVVAVLFSKYFKQNDNFILSAGHGSALLYSILYMRGILSIDDLKNFRNGHITPGHPEYNHDGVDSTTGPLGQGIASGIGLALSGERTFILAGDGCLMEGIALEAIAIAGNLNLNNLIILWDNNNCTIDGKTDLCRTEHVEEIFLANNWNVHSIDGHNFQDIDHAFNIVSNKPLMIACQTIIGKYSPYAGSYKAHAKIMTDDELYITKQNMEWYHEPFVIPDNIYYDFPKIPPKNRNLPIVKLSTITHTQQIDNKATREYIVDIIQMLEDYQNDIIYGSADLSQSTYVPNNIYYGTREHAMIGIMNGISISGKLPIASTFLAFLDYGRAAIRIAAISKLRTIIFATHDSILVGEDGPTHQPIEHIASFRAMPNVLVFRPYDLNEFIASMQIALQHNGPSIFALSRQKIDRKISGYKNYDGVYIIDTDTLPIIDIWASGSEVAIAYDLKLLFNADNIPVRILSAYCLDIFHGKFSSKYSISIEYASTFGWHKYHNGLVIGIDTFGMSACAQSILRSYRITAQDIYMQAKSNYLYELYQ